MGAGNYSIESLEPRRLFAVVFTVTNTNDSGDGSLRAAINNANVVQTPQSATILFNIPGSGVQTIKPLSQLPTITVQLDIEGTTDSSGNPLIEIDGENAGDSSGLVFNRNTNGNDKPSVVSGLVINRFEENGILIGGSAPTDVYGCRIGTDPTGTIAENNLEGIGITGNNNQIGLAGAGAAFQTIVSGNQADGIDIGGNNNIVQNCSVGADANGGDLGNGAAGIGISGSNNLIGGDRPGEGNQIVDNSPGLANPGIFISGQFNVVLSNTIEDNTNGIELDGASNNQIGDGSDADQNLINGSREGVGIGITDNSNNNLIDDNVIGYKPFDKVVEGNQIGVAIVNSSDNTLDDDIIDSNGGDAVEIMCIGNNVAADANQIDASFIGSDPAADTDSFLGNSGNGINLQDGTNTQILNNLIFNSGLDGIHLNDSTTTTMRGNEILGSVHDGVRLVDSSNNSIDDDIIGTSHGDGVLIQQSTGTATGNEMDEDHIGTNDDNDDMNLGNRGNGVDILGATTTDFQNSEVCNNRLAGLEINGATANGDLFGGGGMFNNGKLGISIGDNIGTDHPNHVAGVGGIGAPDDAINHPLLSAAVVVGNRTEVTGTFVASANTTFEMQFYASPSADPSGFGQGKESLGEEPLTTDANGNANFDSPMIGRATVGGIVSCIALNNSTGDISEFSNAVKATGAIITGSVFNDANGNGKQDAGEKSLAKQMVFLDVKGTGIFDDDFDPSAKTNSNGNFTITAPPSGTFHLDLITASGFVQTLPGAKKPFYKLTITPQSHFGGNVFGEKKITTKAADRSVVSAPLIAPAASMFDVGTDDRNRTTLEQLL